jgi:hypothetical protein
MDSRGLRGESGRFGRADRRAIRLNGMARLDVLSVHYLSRGYEELRVGCSGDDRGEARATCRYAEGPDAGV